MPLWEPESTLHRVPVSEPPRLLVEDHGRASTRSGADARGEPFLVRPDASALAHAPVGFVGAVGDVIEWESLHERLSFEQRSDWVLDVPQERFPSMTETVGVVVLNDLEHALNNPVCTLDVAWWPGRSHDRVLGARGRCPEVGDVVLVARQNVLVVPVQNVSHECCIARTINVDRVNSPKREQTFHCFRKRLRTTTQVDGNRTHVPCKRLKRTFDINGYFEFG